MFTPTRGVGQGDPLSPYLFLFVAEDLSCLLKGVETRGEIEGIRVCRDAPEVSHLLFADDSLILMHTDKKECREPKESPRQLLHKFRSIGKRCEV
jgi:hypothetical protein